MTILTFLILALACYRLTHLVVFDKIVEPIRNLFVTRNFFGPMPTYTLQGGPLRRAIGIIINCFWCSGIWVAALVVFVYYAWPVPTFYFCLIWALAAVQSLIETGWTRAVGWPEMHEEVKRHAGP